MTNIVNKLFVVLSIVIDVAVSTILFVRGTKWNLFLSSIVNYSFPESFIDIWLWTIVRACIIIGCLLGTLRNPQDGPSRLKQHSWIASTVGCLNAYYTCIKLLSFSEQPEFTMGSTMKWFWGLFSWNLFGIGIFIYQWNCVGHLSKTSNLEQKIVSNSEDGEETQSLLGNGVSPDKGYSSINSTEQDGSFVQYSGEKRNTKSRNTPSKSKGKKASGKKEDEKEEKTFSELVNKATLGKMFSFVVPDWPLILTGLIFLVGASVAEVFLPLFTGKVVTGIVVSGDRSIFAKNLVEMAAISMVASICAGLRGGCFMVTIQRLNIRVRNALFSSILSQEIGFFDEVRTGEITSRLTSDTTTMSDTVGLNCNIFLRSLIKGIGVCVFMFALSWRLSIVTFMGLPLVFAVSKVYGKYYKKLQEQVQDRFAYANEVAEEVCSSMQTVRSFANENGEKKRYYDRLKDVYKIQLKQSISYSGYLWSTEITGLLLVVGVLWYGGHLVLSNLMGSDKIVSFVLYQFTMADCLNSVGSVYTGLMQALGAAEKVFTLIDRTPKISTEEGKLEPPNLEGHIKFENVTFTYPTRPEQPVLQDVSFEVCPGEVVALVGPSGGGKSSCVKLIQRFYDCTSGSVLVDGRPVNCYKHDYLHERIALVGQEPVLYARSISENIAYGLDEQKFSEESIQQAAKTANAHSFISELKDGYKTETGEKGTQLSGGQKQRVAIARALVRNPRILLLDEATSALDAESEFLVQEALERSKADRTVLLIAHRLSTVERADRIVVIVKGKVVEQGSHLELMAKEGLYFKLVHRQLHTSTGDDEKAIEHLPNDDDVATTSHTSSSPVISLRRRRGSESSSMASSFGSSLGTSVPRM